MVSTDRQSGALSSFFYRSGLACTYPTTKTLEIIASSSHVSFAEWDHHMLQP